MSNTKRKRSESLATRVHQFIDNLPDKIILVIGEIALQITRNVLRRAVSLVLHSDLKDNAGSICEGNDRKINNQADEMEKDFFVNLLENWGFVLGSGICICQGVVPQRQRFIAASQIVTLQSDRM